MSLFSILFRIFTNKQILDQNKYVKIRFQRKVYINSFLLCSLPDTLMDLLNKVKGEGLTRWIVAIPLLHLLRGTSKPFEPVSLTVNSKNEQSWAGLQGLKSFTKALTTQDRRYFFYDLFYMFL